MVGVFFVVTRAALIGKLPPPSDVGVYAEYAWTYHHTGGGREFYQFHADYYVQRDGPETSYRHIEYPPLAVQFFRLPLLFVDVPPEKPTIEYLDDYRRVFRWMQLAIDTGLSAWLILTIHRMFRAESILARSGRLAVYVCSSGGFWLFLYERIDLALAALMVAGMALLLRRRPLPALALLGIGTAFKLVPLILAPLWVIGAVSMTAITAWHQGRRLPMLRQSAVYLAFFGFVAAAGVVPFVMNHGDGALGFFAYHKSRGIEFGSLAGWIPMILGWFGHPYQIVHTHNSINVQSSLTPALSTATAILTPLLLLATLAWQVRRILRQPQAHGATVGEAFPAEIVRGSLLLLLIFILGNKVFSPQYLIWLMPLLPLLRARYEAKRQAMLLFVVLCGMTELMYQFYWYEITGLIERPPQAPTWRFGTPTPVGVALLGFRQAMLLGFGAILYRARPAASDAEH
jgi:hypothetical protein